MKKPQKSYPLYETTHFRDFRIMVEQAADRFPNRVAYAFRENPRKDVPTEITFAQSREDIRGLGTGLIAMGCRGAHVALIGEGSYPWISTYYALMAISAVVVPIDKDLPESDMAGIIRAADCTFVIYSNKIESKILECRKELDPDLKLICFRKTKKEGIAVLHDVMEQGKAAYLNGDHSYYEHEIDIEAMAAIVFTSGTTGKGKGVMLSQKNITLDMTNGMYNFDITPRTVCVLPPHHTFGSSVNYVGHYAQGKTVYISSGLRYMLQEFQEQQPSHLILVPLFVENIYKKIWMTAAKQGKDKTLRRLMAFSNGLRRRGIDIRRKLFSSVTKVFGGNLQMIICGGAALNQDIIDTFDAIGITVLNGYGITECSPLVCCNRNEYQEKGSVGTPIIDETIRILFPDERGEGEIAVKGPNVMLGYYKNQEATAAAFTEDGFFRTGDIGKLDADGWLYITGRLKNVIILSNGKNVYPEEIETELSRIYGVSEVVVYCGESRKRAQKDLVVAEFFPDFEALSMHGIEGEEAIQSYLEQEVGKVNDKMVSYKHIQMVRIRSEEFAKNTSRKITRFNINKNVD